MEQKAAKEKPCVCDECGRETPAPYREHPMTGSRMAGDSCFCKACYEKLAARYDRERMERKL